MNQIRDRNAALSDQEIDAIKVTQDIIKRMAESSQKTKSVFLVASGVFFTLVAKKDLAPCGLTAIIFLVFALFFWIMDARYLRLERQFRAHHKAIVDGLSSLDMWDFSPSRYKTASLPRIMLSFSEIPYPTIMMFVPLFFLL